MAAAATSTATGPSTNRPLSCVLCQETEGTKKRGVALRHVHWSYNMPFHIETEHANKLIPESFKKEYTVTEEELGNLGISVKKQPPKAQEKKKRKAAEEAGTSVAKKSRT